MHLAKQDRLCFIHISEVEFPVSSSVHLEVLSKKRLLLVGMRERSAWAPWQAAV